VPLWLGVIPPGEEAERKVLQKIDRWIRTREHEAAAEGHEMASPLSPEELEELANQDEKRLARMQEITQILPTLRL
jgi:diadenosine tetraphosphate (Ap4A) HIT family hydrolase